MEYGSWCANTRMSPASNHVDATFGTLAHPAPLRMMWYDTTCCALGRIIEENASGCGTSTPHGNDASVRKNRAPVSFTMRRTSDNGSAPCTWHDAGGSAASDAMAERPS